MQSSTEGFHRMNSLQYLRAICALGVVLYHLERGVNVYWQTPKPLSLFSWGGLGVPAFFCLSGFVISYSGYLRPKKSVDFLFSRLARIYPAYLLVAALFVVALLILPANTFNSAPAVSLETIARTIVFDLGRMGGYVYVGWTLFYEMMFYLGFALVSFRFSTAAKNPLFYYVTASGLLACFAFSKPRIADFLIGIAVFLLLVRPLRRGWLSPPYLVLLAALSIGLFVHPVGFFCGLIILLLILGEHESPHFFASKPLLLLGDSSYSIYLVQVLTVSAALKASKLIAGYLPFKSSGYYQFYFIAVVLCLVLTILAGALMRRYLERPSYAALVAWRNAVGSRFGVSRSRLP